MGRLVLSGAKDPQTDSRPGQTIGEEIANSITHGLGLIASLAGMPVLVIAAVTRGDIWQVASVSVFSLTLVLLYTTSTIYHALRPSLAKRVFWVLDHSAIYLLIAGTYTPFALVNLRGPWGWTLFGLVWGLAAFGVVCKAVFRDRFPVVSLVLYLAMGWMVVTVFKLLLSNVAPAGIAWLVAGGVLYTLGVVFFVLRRMPYAHAVWHLFVIAGSTCHYFAVLWYSVGRKA